MSDPAPIAIQSYADGLFIQVSAVIERGRQAAAARANAALTLTNWHIGRLINSEVLHDERADYGKQIRATTSLKWTAPSGPGHDRTSLSRIRSLAGLFLDAQIVVSPIRELDWPDICVKPASEWPGGRCLQRSNQ
jgi:hypothetical protein